MYRSGILNQFEANLFVCCLVEKCAFSVSYATLVGFVSLKMNLRVL